MANGGKKGGKKPGYLQQYDLGPGFNQIIEHAVRNQWNQGEFEHHLVLSKPFQRLFPGFVDHKTGHVATFLLGAGTLQSQIHTYKTLRDQYEHVASLYPGVKVTKDLIGMMISGEVSPDEFAARAQADVALKQNPNLLAAFNQQLKESGQLGLIGGPLDAQDMLKFLAGAAAPKLYDAYEAAQLRASGLGLSPGEAAAAAQGIGKSGSPTDVSQIIFQTKSALGDIGPELERSGISLNEVIGSYAAQGMDAAGIGIKLNQLADQRRALGGYVAGGQARKGAAGGVALYEDQAASGV